MLVIQTILYERAVALGASTESFIKQTSCKCEREMLASALYSLYMPNIKCKLGAAKKCSDQ